MFSFEDSVLQSRLQADMHTVAEENSRIITGVSVEEAVALTQLLLQAKRIFVIGAGRTGLMMKAAAMRFMHLGLTVYVAGETTTPAITSGDVLIAASGSGTTSSIVKAAEKAHAAGAMVAAVSTVKQSPLAAFAQAVLVIPAAQKQDFHGTITQQYAGSLFEQSVLLVMDALFQSMWTLSGTPPEVMWKLHANIE
ncbi:6-phospho-3-hexuloisomerase [Filimonas zeae]|uniref:3-hexulose-6-phosphate isomerase n=1 Tax=Filimonas zeae TaxID=1737353 RepID=A0A917IVE9_9BACT|nr:6-phospho-3-hexuloisomerase [Filimonas zeae]MDR6339272.1 6-phospho-3-hexuloisomerase [Filimonas zeae]GGH64357.1 3-hexulose-6-phosphate isomerase [Filimonas zeae]